MATRPKTARRVTFHNVVPVISTGHAPSPEALDQLKELNMVAAYEQGVFVFVGTESTESVEWPDWMVPIVKWFQSAYPGEGWLRFDSVGDPVDGLIQHDW